MPNPSDLARIEQRQHPLVKRRPRIGDMAFWAYDRYPYLLWAKIERVLDGGTRVSAEGFGNSCFRVAFTAPPKRGEEIAGYLQMAKNDHESRLTAANRASALQFHAIAKVTDIPILDRYQRPMLGEFGIGS